MKNSDTLTNGKVSLDDTIFWQSAFHSHASSELSSFFHADESDYQFQLAARNFVFGKVIKALCDDFISFSRKLRRVGDLMR